MDVHGRPRLEVAVERNTEAFQNSAQP
jgi:hypothetical protein